MSEPFRSLLDGTNVDAILARGTDIAWDRVAPRLISEDMTAVEFAAAIVNESDNSLEELARAAKVVRTKRFGNAIKIYAPVYVSNECVNACRYCGFNARQSIRRVTLGREDALHEARVLIEQGHRHLLLVAGEHDAAVPIDLLEAIACDIRPHVASLGLEVGPTTEAHYRRLAAAGIDGVTLYQETYGREVYAWAHPAGPKADFDRRLNCIEWAGAAGMRFMGIGALLGLADWRRDAMALYLHARYLQKRFWRAHITISVPRLHVVPRGFDVPRPVTDRDLVRLIVALRCALPDAGIVISTRESAELRNHLVPLGITQMSAGSRTEPGGYARPREAGEQFAVSDERTPAQVARSLRTTGFDPVFKDWESCLYGTHNGGTNAH